LGSACWVVLLADLAVEIFGRDTIDVPDAVPLGLHSTAAVLFVVFAVGVFRAIRRAEAPSD
jgi:hypothetical protein